MSVYIPCFNAEKYIKSCLDGVLKQTYPVGEILIVDDASTDRTIDIASKFPVKIIRQPENKGLACARNTAIKNAKSEFVASLDADCVPEKDWLEKLMSNFDLKVAGVGGSLIENDTRTPIGLWRSMHMRQGWGRKKTSSISFLFGSNSVFRKKILMDINGYNEKYFKNNYEDVDISARIKKKGLRLIYEPCAEAMHIREDDVSTLFNAFWNWNFHFHCREGYYKNNKKLYLKIRENIGLANRFLREDYNKKRPQLTYLDFLLSISLTLKDFLFFYKRPNFFDVEEEGNFLVHFVNLADLSLFYHLGTGKKTLGTLIRPGDSFSQNFLVFLLVTGSVLRKRFKDTVFLKETMGYFLGRFMKKKNDFMLEKLLLMIESHEDWDGFLKKGHPNLETRFLNIFIENFKNWLDSLNYRSKNILRSIKNSQKRTLITGGSR